jgi:hypothetical protein
MKTRLIIVLIVFLGVFSDVYATKGDTIDRERKPIEFKMIEPTKVQLMHKVNPDGLLFVKVYDAKETLIVNERISKKNPFSKNYDFSKVAPGKYVIALHDAKGVVEKMEIDLRKPAYNNGVFTRVEQVGKNKYKLLVNNLLESDMVVSIYDNGYLIHEEVFPHSKGFQKVYNLVNTANSSQVEFKVSTERGYSRLMSTR